jgi:pyruvate carboxylase
VRDRSIQAEVPTIEKSDPVGRSHVAAPLTGVITCAVASGATVEAGDAVATIEAMRWSRLSPAPRSGEVLRVAAPAAGTAVEPGDLVAVVGRGIE